MPRRRATSGNEPKLRPSCRSYCRALAAADERSRASSNCFLSFACSSAVISGFAGFGGRSSTGRYFGAGAGASARASINEELELAQPPIERPNTSTAAAAAARSLKYAKLMPAGSASNAR
jgi:hypothetical protein